MELWKWKIGSSAPIFRITTLLLGFRLSTCFVLFHGFTKPLLTFFFCRHSSNFDIYLDHVITSSDKEHTAGATGQQSIFTSPRHMIASLSFRGPCCSALNLSFAFFLIFEKIQTLLSSCLIVFVL